MQDALIVINVQIPEGEKSIVATPVSSAIAVHRTTFASGHVDPKNWSVTHVPTGMRFPVPGFETRKIAMAWAKLLVERFGDDPMSGMVWDRVNRRIKRKPKQFAAVVGFVKDSAYGHIGR
jgi:hypothetical protein